jgi:hypothetical protein
MQSYNEHHYIKTLLFILNVGYSRTSKRLILEFHNELGQIDDEIIVTI